MQVKASEIKKGDKLTKHDITATRVTNPDKNGNVRVAYVAGHVLMHPDQLVEIERG